jgi:hypothetical protein
MVLVSENEYRRFCDIKMPMLTGKYRCSNCHVAHNSNIDHVNLMQSPTTHRFCSKECRHEWCIRGGKGKSQAK